jgi:hypothetical protein
MGTDHPFDMAEYDPIGHVAAVEALDAATIAAIVGGNAGGYRDCDCLQRITNRHAAFGALVPSGAPQKPTRTQSVHVHRSTS